MFISSFEGMFSTLILVSFVFFSSSCISTVKSLSPISSLFDVEVFVSSPDKFVSGTFPKSSVGDVDVFTFGVDILASGSLSKFP